MPFVIHAGDMIHVEEFPLQMRPNKKALRPYVGGGTLYEATCRAVCGNLFFASDSSSTSASLAGSKAMFRRATEHDIKSVKLWRKWLHRGKTSEYGSYAPPDPKDFDNQDVYARVVEANRAIRSVGLLRRFVELDSGYVGMAAGAIEGDEVVVVMGARTPFAVRRVGELKIDGGEKKMAYVVVGECYLVGGMDGELMGSMEKGEEEMYLL
ncbi:hypothetical protein K505DRAFT_330306 [Melanomma pulvis-pyrius CBS 109.77]|uniref:Uncharacterized protein n=1 Tax=Melanomma pulvis-pyrius CBS 109.77 TaxID=1314802 RepID=A0A6A6WRU4_9PLEO|nr:hypothetical protein K505DRAFT_330306 [Melanomma pulvis-pyrius CBS 109.77]